MSKPINPSAMTGLKMAFQAGFKSGLRGGHAPQPHYKSEILNMAYERGFRKAKEGKK